MLASIQVGQVNQKHFGNNIFLRGSSRDKAPVKMSTGEVSSMRVDTSG